MINFLKNFFDRYFFDDEQFAALFIISIGIIILYFLGGIIAPVLVSILIAYILNGFMSFLEEKGNSRFLALSVTLFIFSLFYLSIFLVLPFLSRQILLLVSDIPQIYESVNVFLSSQLANYTVSSNQLDEALVNAFSYIPTLFQNALLQLNSGFSAVMNALLYLIIVPFLVFFLLKDRDIFLNYVKVLLPEKKDLLSKIWKDVNIQLYGYLRGKGLEMLVVTLVTGLVFYMQGCKLLCNFSYSSWSLSFNSLCRRNISYNSCYLNRSFSMGIRFRFLYFYCKLFNHSSFRWKRFDALASRQGGQTSSCNNHYGCANFWRNLGILGFASSNSYCNFFKGNISLMAN